MTRKPCICIGQDLFEAAKYRLEAAGYESFSGYVVGLIRADLLTLPDHRVALKIMNLGGRARDKIDEGLLRQTKSVPIIEVDEDIVEDVIDLAKAYRAGRTGPIVDSPGDRKRAS